MLRESSKELRRSMGSPSGAQAAALATDSADSDLGGGYRPPKLAIPSMTMGGGDVETI